MKKVIALVTLLTLAAISSHAATVTSLVGDQDGFNQGLLPDQGFNYVTIAAQPGEAANSDTWIYGSQSWTHTYDISSLGALTSASITIYAGGLGYGASAQLYLGAQLIGTLSDGDDVGPAYNYTKLDTFDLLPYAALLTGSNTFTIQTIGSDGWTLDYSRLDFTSRTSSVPDSAATVMLLGAALLSLAAFKRRVAA